MRMNIQKFSNVTDLPVYTIRYYEKIGLFLHIQRNSSGHRVFTKNDIAWAKFIKRLKETGMPLSTIRKYTDLREEGDHTATLRMKLLQKHSILLKEKIDLDLEHLRNLKKKITYYNRLIQKTNGLT
jgi:DNA-binding transcriptional MerR regulator